MWDLRTLWLVPGLPPPRHLGLLGPCVTFTPLTRMIDWVSWPLGKNIDKWIIALLKGLAAVKKFSILIEVSLTKIEKVGALLSSYLLMALLTSFSPGTCRSERRRLGASTHTCCVTWGNSLSLSGPQVPPFIPLTVHSSMRMLLRECLSAH